MPPQTITEKHKLNVPETMTEMLDVSDEEGELNTEWNQDGDTEPVKDYL